MKTDLFDFNLPSEYIATMPINPRDCARMLVVESNHLRDSNVVNLPDFLQEGDVMIFNNTKVIPARLQGKRGEVNIEVTLHKALDNNRWMAFAKPGKKLRIGDKIIFADDFSTVVEEKFETGEIKIQFECDDLLACLRRYGKMPLPPYIKRAAEENDNKDYQTIYAHTEGAVAAPTAGLHFTDNLFDALKKKKAKLVFITLHVGAGTFLPVKVEDTKQHKMHSEYAEISQEAANVINEAKKAGGRVIAVGTTSLRALESAANKKSGLSSFKGETSIFITPGYKFKIVDMLMTNFHLPRSTLFMLVSAFSGLKTMKEAYKHAIEENYRFYSYGDACLLYKQ